MYMFMQSTLRESLRMVLFRRYLNVAIYLPGYLDKQHNHVLPPPNGEDYVFISVGLCVSLFVCFLATSRKKA